MKEDMRDLYEDERLLVLRLMLGSRIKILEDQHLLPKVEEMEDGGMGGLIFVSNRENRVIGQEVGRFEFRDDDGVEVIATLSLDNYGDLYELDMWKTDFSALKSFPKI